MRSPARELDTLRGYWLHGWDSATPRRRIDVTSDGGTPSRWGQTVPVTDPETPPAAARTSPSATPESRSETTTSRRFQPRHAGYIALLLVVAVAVFAVYRNSATVATNLDGGKIERLIPTPGSKVLQQETIGIDLAPGYEGSLTLNGTPLPDSEVTFVPQLNQITFKPGPNRIFEQLPPGDNCLIATYWESAFGPSVSTSRSWCFTVV
jgi:hypothetical protein